MSESEAGQLRFEKISSGTSLPPWLDRNIVLVGFAPDAAMPVCSWGINQGRKPSGEYAIKIIDVRYPHEVIVPFPVGGTRVWVCGGILQTQERKWIMPPSPLGAGGYFSIWSAHRYNDGAPRLLRIGHRPTEGIQTGDKIVAALNERGDFPEVPRMEALETLGDGRKVMVIKEPEDVRSDYVIVGRKDLSPLNRLRVAEMEAFCLKKWLDAGVAYPDWQDEVMVRYSGSRTGGDFLVTGYRVFDLAFLPIVPPGLSADQVAQDFSDLALSTIPGPEVEPLEALWTRYINNNRQLEALREKTAVDIDEVVKRHTSSTGYDATIKALRQQLGMTRWVLLYVSDMLGFESLEKAREQLRDVIDSKGEAEERDIRAKAEGQIDRHYKLMKELINELKPRLGALLDKYGVKRDMNEWKKVCQEFFDHRSDDYQLDMLQRLKDRYHSSQVAQFIFLLGIAGREVFLDRANSDAVIVLRDLEKFLRSSEMMFLQDARINTLRDFLEMTVIHKMLPEGASDQAESLLRKIADDSDVRELLARLMVQAKKELLRPSPQESEQRYEIVNGKECVEIQAVEVGG